jgi:hypothetical protein
MKKYLLSIITLSLLAFSTESCTNHGAGIMGRGNKVVQHPGVSTFSAIQISVPMKADIRIQDGATPSIEIAGYENLLSHIKVKVENNKLVVYSDLHWNISFGREDDQTTAIIILPGLIALSLKGSPDAVIHGPLTSENFELEVSGSSSVSIDSMNTGNFSASISGNGDLTINGGTTKQATYQISGSGDINAFPLQAQESTASISGSGSAEVTAIQKLSVNVSGSGDIKYKGHPSISQNISGSGDITDAN